MNAYKKFAYFYDEVMASLNYDLWLEYVEPFLKPNDKILDLACGTGVFATMLKLKGFEAEGLDLSETIIEIAKEKAKINRLNIPFYIADMTSFLLNKKFNVITCFFDSVNFLSSPQDVQKLFECVKAHLQPGGLFIFDIFSQQMMKEYEHHHLQEDHVTFQLDWKTKKQNATTLQHQITITEADEVLKEDYYEYYYELKSLNLDGFKLLKVSGDFNEDLQDEDERILVVLQLL